MMPVLCRRQHLRTVGPIRRQSGRKHKKHARYETRNKIQHYKTRTITLLRAPPTAKPMPRPAAIREEAVSCSSLFTHLLNSNAKITQRIFSGQTKI